MGPPHGGIRPRPRLPGGLILSVAGPWVHRLLFGRFAAEESGGWHLHLSAEVGKKTRVSFNATTRTIPRSDVVSNTRSGVVGFGSIDFSSGGEMKKVLLVLTLVGLGFLAWRYFSNEPV